MRIDFFEEYPTFENLARSKQINFPSTIYIAAESLNQFQKHSQTLKLINPKPEPAYWPILKSSYWISPLSDTKDLESLKSELFQKRKSPLKVLIDLEPPILHPWQIIKNIASFKANRSLIKSILESEPDYNLLISTAELPGTGPSKKLLKALGLNYSQSTHTHQVVNMHYASIIGEGFLKRLRKHLRQVEGLGTIAAGPYKLEPILPPEKLDNELSMLKEKQIEKVIIYRLGGLNKKYLKVLQKYT